MFGPMHPAFDWKNPDYDAVFAERGRRLEAIRADAKLLADLKVYYADNPADFINDWGVTVDPRVASLGRNPLMPFLLFPRQREFIDWILECWRLSTPGIGVKSRDVGASWIAMALGCTLGLHRNDFMVGVGSAKEDKIDRSGDPDCLFYKGRMFLQYLPAEFRGGWDLKKHSAHMRLQFPQTNSSVTGEAGDNIGRGGRKSIYFVDESAHLERPLLVDASLAATTDCRIDLSSVNGPANPFAIKARGGTHSVFNFAWRDDPRKNDEWYAKKAAELDPVVLASEIDCNFSASVEGVVIPAQWVQAAIDLHVKLGLVPTGTRHSALDVADEGKDKNAQSFRYGILLEDVEEWSGKDSDIYHTTNKAFLNCDLRKLPGFDYDGDGMGAAVKGDARNINALRIEKKVKPLVVNMFRGSDAVYKPEDFVRGPDGKPLDRKNKDMFANYKAQAWWHLRFLFQQAFRASQGMPYDPDNIISISSKIAKLSKLVIELSQPTYDHNTAGKMVIEKQPEGVASPNLGDSVMMVYAPRRLGLKIADSLLGR